MRIYLDNCCYNRPYDVTIQITVLIEAQCKLQIQKLVKDGVIALVSSYMTRYELSQNPHEEHKKNIDDYINRYSSIYVGGEHQAEIEEMAADIMTSGVKFKDACHVAAAIYAECDCFISTDKRLLKYTTSRIKLLTPVEFFSFLEGGN